MRDTLFIWVEAYEYPSGLRIEAFLWSASIILGRFMKDLDFKGQTNRNL